MSIIKDSALALCRANNESPDGTMVRFLNDGMHSRTFLQARMADAITAARAIRDGLQAHAEAQPIEEYGPWRRAVEWLDKQIHASRTPAQGEGE